ncbi:hypothetical protein AMTRI_Chr08g162800 [Amborella trichopoda]
MQGGETFCKKKFEPLKFSFTLGNYYLWDSDLVDGVDLQTRIVTIASLDTSNNFPKFISFFLVASNVPNSSDFFNMMANLDRNQSGTESVLKQCDCDLVPPKTPIYIYIFSFLKKNFVYFFKSLLNPYPLNPLLYLFFNIFISPIRIDHI